MSDLQRPYDTIHPNFEDLQELLGPIGVAGTNGG